MTGSTIFLVDADGNLARMRAGAPVSEDQMQALVAKHPDLIAGAEGGLLLVKREQPISDTQAGPSRWSVDHLFVTRDAVPVLVELKRAVDTRLRREVVGQMMDYAANAVSYWPAGQVADAFEATCAAMGKDAEETLLEFLQGDDAQAFWDQVDANVLAGRIKLVFVADAIPPELARIVEFMNEQMRADVRAVELRWYDGDGGVTTLVPRVIGETARATARKSTANSNLSPVTRDEWIEQHLTALGPQRIAGANIYIELVEALGGRAAVAKQQGSVIAIFKGDDGKLVYPVQLWRDGTVSVSFRWLRYRPRLVDEAVRRRFYELVAAVVGPLSTDNVGGYPSFDVNELNDEAVVEQLRAVLTELISEAVKAD